MNLHEYQAKQLLAKYGMPVPRGEVARTAVEALLIADRINSGGWVVKAQVHAGGRGKAGGVRLVKTKDELAKAVQELIGKRLVTFQTNADGQPVNQVLIEEISDIERELYLGAVIDRSTKRIVFMASREGGVDIEKVEHETPHKILKTTVDPLVGVQPFQARQLSFALGLKGGQIKQFTQILLGLKKLF